MGFFIYLAQHILLFILHWFRNRDFEKLMFCSIGIYAAFLSHMHWNKPIYITVETAKYPWQASKSSVVVGSQVWVEDPDVAWIDGQVLEIKGDEIKISCTSGKTVRALFSIIFHYIFLHGWELESLSIILRYMILFLFHGICFWSFNSSIACILCVV